LAKNLSTFQTNFLLSFCIIPEVGGSRFLYDVCACPHGITFLVTIIIVFTAMKIFDLKKRL
jgi:hypothetical protein